jgi:integrase
VLDFAKARGWRSGENPAAWRGHLALILPKRGKLSRSHHAAMPYQNLPEFIGKLREHRSVSAAAYPLEFAILTAARSGEVLGSLWSEFDLGAKVWTIPARRMKGGREHRVPSSTKAFAIVEVLGQARASEFVFPGQRSGAPLSPMVRAKVLKRMGATSATVHGFRSSFRDWCGNETSFPREIAEAALAMRPVMLWNGNVVPMRGAL